MADAGEQGPSKEALAGPILDRVPYPGVIVAKARSHTSKDLDLVLYASAEEGLFELGVTRLQPGKEYTVGTERFVVDNSGEASLKVMVKGRTSLLICPCDDAT